MRRSYLVCYDIRNPKRLRRIHKILKGYGIPWQLSVFFCSLKKIDRVRLQADLQAHMNQKEDQVMMIDLGTIEKDIQGTVVVIGKSLPESDLESIVI